MSIEPPSHPGRRAAACFFLQLLGGRGSLGLPGGPNGSKKNTVWSESFNQKIDKNAKPIFLDFFSRFWEFLGEESKKKHHKKMSENKSDPGRCCDCVFTIATRRSNNTLTSARALFQGRLVSPRP
jgi:hypothetical protein